MDFRGLYHYAPAFGDLDGDGKLDIVMGSFSAKMAWYRSDGTGAAPHFTIVDSVLVEITRGSNTTPALGDVDGDGDLDLFVGEASGTLNFYRNDGGPSRPLFTLVSDVYDSIDVGRRSAPALVDIDRDGDLDLLVGRMTAAWCCSATPARRRKRGSSRIPCSRWTCRRWPHRRSATWTAMA